MSALRTRLIIDPVQLQEQLDRLGLYPANSSVAIQIGIEQLRVMLEVTLLAGRVQDHEHRDHVLAGIDQSIAGTPPDAPAGRGEVLRLLFELVSGMDYDTLRKDYAADQRAHLTVVK